MKELSKEEMLKVIKPYISSDGFVWKMIVKAMQRFSDQNTKPLIDEIAELKAKLESKNDECNEYSANCNKYHDLYLSKDGDNKQLQSDLKAAKSVNEQLSENQTPEYLIEFIDDVKHMIKLYNNSSYTRSEEYRDKLAEKLDVIRTIDLKN